jgi:hypothetical protein
MIIQIEPFANDDHTRCAHARCDGRDAKWQFPQTSTWTGGPIRCCRVHIGHFVEIILEQIAGYEPIKGRRG